MQSAQNDCGGDDAEDSSISSTTAPVGDSLEEFRRQWREELCVDRNAAAINHSESQEQVDKAVAESKATKLFMQGVESEHIGKVYDAMNYYRRAMKYDPDIEFKVYEANQRAARDNSVTKKSSEDSKSTASNDDANNLDGVDLYERFQTALAKQSGSLCEPVGERGAVILTQTHISMLPPEIMLQIMKWVVSADLDLRSLERCAAVSKGFYLCARDPDIWRRACLKVWGINTGELFGSQYLSWRQMFLNRPRVLFHGCYISKTSYLRYGENSFQDTFYRPVQLVEYYRYFRFFPDGTVLMLTSADDPNVCVSRLKHRQQARKDVYKGHFRVQNCMLNIVMKPIQNQPSNKRQDDQKVTRTFYMEFEIANPKPNVKCKSKFGLLKWKIYTTTEEKDGQFTNRSEFELSKRRYPPFFFSRVNSYHSESFSPLN